MVSYGPGVAGFEKVNSYSTRELSATHDDLDIARGHVVQAVVDLELPGKGPVGLNLSRFYSSRNYRSSAEISATSNRLWGALIGNGWNMNIGMRVYVVREYDLKNCRVILDSGSLEIFDATGNAGEEYRTRDTPNQSRIELFDASGIRIQNPQSSRTSPIAKVVMTTLDGIVYSFEREFYNEVHGLYGGDLTIRGFCLTSIGDLFGNKSTITYQEFSPQIQDSKSYSTRYIMQVQTSKYESDNLAVYRIPHIVGQTYKRLIDMINAGTAPMNPVYSMSSLTKRLRPVSILDSMGRTITLEYQAVPVATTICRVSKINYPAPNGVTGSVTYAYDVSGNLTSVQRNSLPSTRYTYSKYTPGYALYYYPHVKKSGTNYVKDRDIYLVDFPDTIVYNGYFTNGWSLSGMEALGYASSSKLTYLYGSLLASVETPLGLKTNYIYGDTMKRGSLQTVPTKDANSVGIDYTPQVQAASYPVVIEKQWVTLTNGTYRFQLSYPKTGTLLGPLVGYTGKNMDPGDLSWAFPQVTIDGPSQIEDVTYTFQNGVEVSSTQGTRQRLTTWDFARMLPTKITEKRNGIVVQETETTGYDRYRNPLIQILRKSLTNTIRREWTYATDSTLIAKNRVSLVGLYKEIDLASGAGSRNLFREYTADGLPSAEYWGVNSQGKLLNRWTYDLAGRLASVTTPGPGGNDLLQYSYVDLGSIYRATLTRNGKTVTSEFDKPSGVPIKSTDENGNSTVYEWDLNGRITKIVPPIGGPQTIAYSNDLKTTTVTSLGRNVSTTQDDMGRLILTDNPDGEEDVKTTYYYGNAIQKTSVNSGSGWVDKTSVEYDSQLRPIAITQVGQGKWTAQYDDSTSKTRVTVQNPAGFSTSMTNDEWGRAIEQIDDVGGVNASTKSNYNGFLNLTKLIDPRANSIQYDYDGYGRLANVGHLGTVATRYSYTYAIDGQGYVVRVDEKDRNGNLMRWMVSDYDIEGRLKQLTVATNNAASRVVERRTYDEVGAANGKTRLTSAESEGVKTEYGYDQLGREISRKTIIPNLKTYTMGYGYNADNGLLATIEFPDAKKLETRYDVNHRPSEILYQTNRLLSYTFYPNGKTKTISYSNGVLVEYTYINDDWVSQIKVSKGGVEILKQEYGYDTLGRRTLVQYPGYLVSGNAAQVARTYVYDKRDEVTNVAINGSSKYTYGYDLNHNHTRWETPYGVASGNINTTVDTAYDQISEIRYSDGRMIKLAMDAFGNISQKVKIASSGVTVETTDYRYTYHNQLAEVWRNGVKIQSNQYNQDRQRVSVEDGDNGKKWIYWDPAGRIVGEGREGAGEVVVRYVYDGNEKVAMLRTDRTTGVESPYYFINDANGTPLMIMDQTGKVVSKINMDDWGNLNKMRIGSRMEINYTGKKMDTVTGLYYFNQRYYDPEIGRFIQEDLAREYLNPYVYVGNNVANLVDPDGLTTFAELNGCSGCGGTSVRRGFDFNDPSYIGGGDGGSISMENGGGFPSISFGSSSIVIHRANARPLPTVVLAPMSAGEKGAAINNLAEIISSARSGMAFNELSQHAWIDSRESRSPVDKFNDAKRLVNKYGPDALGIAGSAMQMVPHPGVKGVGFGLQIAGNVWGGYNTYKNPTLADSLFYVRGAIPFLPPIFGITSGSASMMYNYMRP